MLKLSHKTLEVYEISLKMIKEIYTATKAFPKEEQYVLISQIRRAAVSVCSNIQKEQQGSQKLKKDDFMKLPEVRSLKSTHNLKLLLS